MTGTPVFPKETSKQRKIYGALALACLVDLYGTQYFAVRNGSRVADPSIGRIYDVPVGSKYHHVTAYVDHAHYVDFWLLLSPAFAFMAWAFAYTAFMLGKAGWSRFSNWRNLSKEKG